MSSFINKNNNLLVGVKSWENVRALKTVLFLFEEIFSLKINFHKSMFFGVNVAGSRLHEAAVVMNYKHGGDSRELDFWHPLVDGIHSKLSGWKSKNISFGG